MKWRQAGAIIIGEIAALALTLGIISLLEQLAPHHVIYGHTWAAVAMGLGSVALGGLIGSAASR